MFEPPTHHNGIKVVMNSQIYIFHWIWSSLSKYKNVQGLPCQQATHWVVTICVVRDCFNLRADWKYLQKIYCKIVLIRLQKAFYPIVLYLAASNIYRWHSSSRIGHLFFCCIENNNQTRLKGLYVCKVIVAVIV